MTLNDDIVGFEGACNKIIECEDYQEMNRASFRHVLSLDRSICLPSSVDPSRLFLFVLPFSHSFHNHAQSLRLSQLPPHAVQTSKSTSLAGVMMLCLTLPLARLSGLIA